MNPYQYAKKRYQIYLEKRARASRSKETIIRVESKLEFQPADRPLRFGIIGTGHVFDRWMHDIRMLPPQAQIEVRAVCSRAPDKIQEKAQALGIGVIYASYEALLADPLIDAIYVATPNQLHAAHTLQALRAGKHVLCEKPACVTSEELEHILTLARQKDLLYMEGMWMLTLPMIRQLCQVVGSGAIGQVQLIQTRCCNANSPQQFPALFDPAKAGGAMMDVGCYALHFARLFLPACEPEYRYTAALTETGVDGTSSVTITAGNVIATLTQSICCAGGAHAALHGTEGSIEIPTFFFPEQFTVISKSGLRTTYRYATPKVNRPIGYAHEILHFADLVRAGILDPVRIPHSDTVAVQRVLDDFRQDCGVAIGTEG